MGLADDVRYHRRGRDSGWDLLVRVVSQRAQFVLTDEERTYLSAPVKPRPQLQFSEWLALFKHRTPGG